MNEKRFLLECIRTYLGKKDPVILGRLSKSIDIGKLDDMLARQNFTGFFYHLFSNNIFEELDVPKNIALAWKQAAGKNSLVNTINDREALFLTDQLSKNNIDYIYIKGLSTRLRSYEVDYIKHSVDIDIYIRKKDYDRVKSILLDNGYTIPRNHYIENIAITIPFEEFEKKEIEIGFVKKIGAISIIVDLQWDFIDSDMNSIFHFLYEINSLYDFNETDILEVENHILKVLSPGIEFANLAFHFAFHHGFRGIQWLTDICSFLNKNEEKIDFRKLSDRLDDNLKKVVGIVLLLADEYSDTNRINRFGKKLFCIDRLLPFEYRHYKNSVLKPVTGVSNSIGLFFTKILLPYKAVNRWKALKYMLFDPDSIGHRIDPKKKDRKIFLPFYLLRLLIFDILRKKK